MPTAWRGEVRRRQFRVYPKARPGHALADCPPPTIPVKCAPADRPSHTLQPIKKGTRSTRVTLNKWLRLSVFRPSKA